MQVSTLRDSPLTTVLHFNLDTEVGYRKRQQHTRGYPTVVAVSVVPSGHELQ
eukprot:m.346350 g.346350  ORF g.346350 m.346350 type:complete len:52 (+) comp20667_c0_seq4:48-203(+)